MPITMFTALRRYSDFRGRASRKEFWLFTLLTVFAGVVAAILDNALGLDKLRAGSGGNGPINGLVNLAFLIPTLAVQVRRFHDVGKTGWLLLLPLLAAVPGVIGLALGGDTAGAFKTLNAAFALVLVAVAVLLGALLYILYLNVRRGNAVTNRFGPDPLAPAEDMLRETFA